MSYGHGTGGYYPPSGGGGYPPPGGGYPPPPPGGGYGGPGFQPPRPASQGSAIGALIANVLGLCFCWALAIVGVILAVIAMSVGSGNPQAAKTCALISWVLFGVGILVWVLLLIFYGGMGLLSGLSTY